MGNRRVGVWVLLLAAGVALGACNLGISGSVGDGPAGENGGKGEELESAGGGFTAFANCVLSEPVSSPVPLLSVSALMTVGTRTGCLAASVEPPFDIGAC